MPIKAQKKGKGPQKKKGGKGQPNKKGKGQQKHKNGPKQGNKGKNQNNNNKNKSNNNKNNNNVDEQKVDDSIQIRGINLIPIDEYTKKGQTFPPTKTINELFDNPLLPKDFPCNQTMPHPGKDGKLRMESDERLAIENEAKYQTRLKDLRQGAEIHRHVRQAAQNYIKPGRSMVDICEFIERSTMKLTGYDEKQPMAAGWGFPTGCSLNHCAAHYTPNSGDKTLLKAKDLCKIDFGVQINGNIIDCAFSMSFDPMHDQLMAAVKAATNAGIEAMGIDVRLCDIGEAIQEVMESHECTYNNKVYPVKSIKNLNGHSIGKYVIHGGKTVPIVKNGDTTKMEEGELFAIETFGSTGKGVVIDDGECSHYGRMQQSELPNYNIDHKGGRDLLKWINKRFGTIPFCRRWLDDEGHKRHIMSLKNLVDHGFVRAYPPLCDVVGSYTAQYEHTIYLKPTCKEVVSRGMDF